MNANFASCLTSFFLIFCRIPSSRYSSSAIEVFSDCWLSQRWFYYTTNGKYFLITLYLSLLHLWVCECVSSAYLSFEITYFVLADL